MRILMRSGPAHEWGDRGKRRRRRRLWAVLFVLVALAGVGAFIWFAYVRSQRPQIVLHDPGAPLPTLVAKGYSG